MATLRQQLDALVNLFVRDIRSAFLAAISDVVDNVTLQRVIDAITAGDVDRAFRELGFSQAAMRPLTAAIERAYEQGGVFTVDNFPKKVTRGIFRFDVRNSRAEAWLRDKSSTLVTRLTDDARQNVRTVITQGMEEGRNPRNVALDIVGRVDPVTKKRTGGIVGLAANQEEWVTNTRRDLLELNDHYFTRELRDKRFDGIVRKAIADGKPLDSATVEKLVGRYRDKALKYRGDMIARTEALQSLNASEYESIRQAVDAGITREQDVQREWDSAGDSRVRWSHRKMDGQRVGLDEPFVTPSGARMRFPGDTSLGAPGKEIIACRCRAKTVVDWLAQALDD